MKLNDQKLRELGLAVIQVEAQAINALAEQINDNFVAACKLLFVCTGRVVVIGMGKSGHIAGKNCRNPCQYRNPGFFCTSRGSQSRRSGHDYQTGCSAGFMRPVWLPESSAFSFIAWD